MKNFFQSIEDWISEDTILTVPSTDYLFPIHVDSSNIGTGFILIQQVPDGKLIMSFNSRFFDKAEQKMSSVHRELLVTSLQCQSTNIKEVDHRFQYISITITNLLSTYGDLKDNSRIVSSDIKLL